MQDDPSTPGHIRARQAGLALTRRVNRWLIAGAVILTGGVSAVTAHAFQARGAAATNPSARATTATGRAHQGAALQGPSQAPTAAAPAPASAPAPVVSGGS